MKTLYKLDSKAKTAKTAKIKLADQKSPVESLPETIEEAVEIQSELVLDKYRQLIRDVINGEKDQKAVEREFEKDLGSDWFTIAAEKTDEDFKEFVKKIHDELTAEKTELPVPAQSQSKGEYRGKYRELDIRLIKPSSTNPRKNFDIDSLKELAASIEQHGVQQPIIVRLIKELPADLETKLNELVQKEIDSQAAENAARVSANNNPGDKSSKEYARFVEKHVNASVNLSSFIQEKLADYGYELIAGERRWRASSMAQAYTIPCIVKNVSDRDAFEIQIIENLQRKDIEPMDEAAGFKNLLDKANFTIQEISLRVGKSPDFVHQRLKLNDLIEAGQKFVARGKLPIGHAMEIAKYAPDIQEMLLDDVFDYYDNPINLARLKQIIESKVLILLKRAPFSLTATNLRADGLACTDCPERSGNLPTLFDKPKAEDDACLNRKCFAAKTQLHVQILRQEISEKVKTKSGDENYLAPVIIDNYGKSNSYPDALNLDQYRKIHNKKERCEFAEEAVSVESLKLGEKQLVCRNGQCSTHYPSGATRAEEKDEKETQKRYDRKEELFDYRTAKRVAPRVFKEAMVKFEGILFDDYALLPELVARFWKLQSYESSDVMGIILNIVSEWTDEKISGYYSYETERVKTVEKLPVGQQFQFLFLLLNAYKGAMFYESYKSQKEVYELAEKYEINYKLLDAEERHALCIEPKSQYKKHSETFKKYMDDVRAGKKAKLPRVYSPDYVKKD